MLDIYLAVMYYSSMVRLDVRYDAGRRGLSDITNPAGSKKKSSQSVVNVLADSRIAADSSLALGLENRGSLQTA